VIFKPRWAARCIALEDVGAMFMQMASTLNPAGSTADQFMHQEIRRLAQDINNAKKEIFSISSDEKSETVLTDASMHLDEVIKATEKATNTIMDSADQIQNLVAGVGGDKETKITEATTRIYDACTFQDISGQRITKVIKLLGNIEERIAKLNSLFGSTDHVPKAANDPMSDKALLNGPQLAGQAASQTDIDALFNSLGGKA
jgi:chemotaxis protein CheZ